jgi:hypothetical protein
LDRRWLDVKFLDVSGVKIGGQYIIRGKDFENDSELAVINIDGGFDVREVVFDGFLLESIGEIVSSDRGSMGGLGFELVEAEVVVVFEFG